MEFSILKQIYIILLSIPFGMVFGAFYDIIRVLRSLLGINYINKFTENLKKIRLKLIDNPLLKEKQRTKLREGVILLITDFAYFLILTIALIIFIYYLNDGIVRWYIFAGTMAGLLIYYFTIGKLVISISEYITFFIKILFEYLFFFLKYPFCRAIRYLKPVFRRLKSGITHLISKKEKVKKKATKRVEIIHAGKSNISI